MKKAHIQEPPSGKVRVSQLVTTYGPGSMIDLLDDAALVTGLNLWKIKGAVAIEEPRLRDALAKRLSEAEPKQELRIHQPFLTPPIGNDGDPTRESGIPVSEFPQWFVCQNPGCKTLSRKQGLTRKGGRYQHDCDDGKNSPCVPVRFVSACVRGHIDDFPWISFVHKDRRCNAPRLRVKEDATGNFSEVELRCHSCGAWRWLSEAMLPEAGAPCYGRRPWLGPGSEEECPEKVRLLVRTASNSYFSQVVSALTIPEKQSVIDLVKGQWGILQAATSVTLPAFRSIPDVGKALQGTPDAEVLTAVEAIKNNTTPQRDPLRTAEYKQFIAAPMERPGEIPKPTDIFFVRRCQPPGVPRQIARVVLARTLREVRVQLGFTRLEAAAPNLEGEFDLDVKTSPLGLGTDWLPACEIRGEGLFLELDEAAVQEWESRPAVQEHARRLLEGHIAWEKTLSGNKPAFPGARFYLLHSLSHLLLSALSLECGYAASAIRERIYCTSPAKDGEGEPYTMAGILLSTGSPGTEGTLGGLVEQGALLEKHLRYALELGRLCSNDPVCAAHDPSHDLSERYLEGAACHSCLFVAECSCERFNRYLDRSLVIPTIGYPKELAFFSELR